MEGNWNPTLEKGNHGNWKAKPIKWINLHLSCPHWSGSCVINNRGGFCLPRSKRFDFNSLDFYLLDGAHWTLLNLLFRCTANKWRALLLENHTHGSALLHSHPQHNFIFPARATRVWGGHTRTPVMSVHSSLLMESCNQRSCSSSLNFKLPSVLLVQILTLRAVFKCIKCNVFCPLKIYHHYPWHNLFWSQSWWFMHRFVCWEFYFF